MKKILLAFTLLLGLHPAHAQIPNSGFEDWIFPSDTIPEFWTSSGFGAGRSTQSNSGMYAAYVWNWYYYAKGWIVNGSPGWFTQFDASNGGTPLNQKPLRLKGSYFYVLGNNGGFADSAFVNVIAKKYNTTLNQADTVALGRLHLPAVSNYTPFSVELTDLIPGTDPDSIVISFWSCFDNNCFCDNSSSGNCMFFYVDDISLDFQSGVLPIDGWFNQPVVFPNPSGDEVAVRVPGAAGTHTLRLYNATGMLVQETKSGDAADLRVRKGNLPAGLYTLEILTDRIKVSHHKVVFE